MITKGTLIQVWSIQHRICKKAWNQLTFSVGVETTAACSRLHHPDIFFFFWPEIQLPSQTRLNFSTPRVILFFFTHHSGTASSLWQVAVFPLQEVPLWPPPKKDLACHKANVPKQGSNKKGQCLLSFNLRAQCRVTVLPGANRSSSGWHRFVPWVRSCSFSHWLIMRQFKQDSAELSLSSQSVHGYALWGYNGRYARDPDAINKKWCRRTPWHGIRDQMLPAVYNVTAVPFLWVKNLP